VAEQVPASDMIAHYSACDVDIVRTAYVDALRDADALTIGEPAHIQAMRRALCARAVLVRRGELGR
jgi:hypothetical protein